MAFVIKQSDFEKYYKAQAKDNSFKIKKKDFDKYFNDDGTQKTRSDNSFKIHKSDLDRYFAIRRQSDTAASVNKGNNTETVKEQQTLQKADNTADTSTEDKKDGVLDTLGGFVEANVQGAKSVFTTGLPNVVDRVTKTLDGPRQMWQDTQATMYDINKSGETKKAVDKYNRFYGRNGIVTKEINERIAGRTEKQAQENRQLVEKYKGAPLGQATAEIGLSTGAMLPSIVANILLPGSGTPMFAANVYGNAEGRALSEGATTDQAMLYAAGNTALETGAQYALGGITKLFEGVAPKRIKQLVSSNALTKEFVKTPTGRIIANRLVDMTGEGMEEVVSGTLEPFLRKAIYDKEAETADLSNPGWWLEQAGNFGSGALVSAILGVPFDVMRYGQAAKTVGNDTLTDYEIKDDLTDYLVEETTNIPTEEQSRERTILPPQAQQDITNTSPFPYGSLAQRENTRYGSAGITNVDPQTQLPFTYAVVDLSDLTTSNHINGNVNTAYPQALQPRDRTRVSSLQQINDIANNLNPELLGENPLAQNGAPIVDADGVVISGNGRTLGLEMAYRQGKAGNYVDYLRKNADRYGIDTSNLPQRPVLVRIAENISNPVELASKLNEATTATYSAAETGVNDRGKLTDRIIGLLTDNENGKFNLNGRENDAFIKVFVNDVVPASDRNIVTDRHGNLTSTGLKRVETAIFTYAYGDNTELLYKMSEDIKVDGKNIVNALVSFAPRAVQLKSRIQNGDLYSKNILDEMLKGIELYTTAKENGITIENRAGQIGLFTGRAAYTPEQALFANAVNSNIRSRKKLKQLFDNVADSLEALGSPYDIRFDMSANDINGITAGDLLKEGVLTGYGKQNNTDQRRIGQYETGDREIPADYAGQNFNANRNADIPGNTGNIQADVGRVQRDRYGISKSNGRENSGGLERRRRLRDVTGRMGQADERSENQIRNATSEERLAATTDNIFNITENDVERYYKTGKKQSTRNEKRRMAESGNSPIINNQAEFNDFIDGAITGKRKQQIKTYGIVNDRLKNAVLNASDGKIDISDKFFEIGSDDVKHSFDGHIKPKEAGDIALSVEDYENIPEYINDFDDIIYRVKTPDGTTKIQLGKKINGYSVITEIVSNERNSVKLRNMWGVSTDKYFKKYKSRAVANRASTQQTPALSIFPSGNINSTNDSVARKRSDSQAINTTQQKSTTKIQPIKGKKVQKDYIDYVKKLTNIDLEKARDTYFDDVNGFNIDTRELKPNELRDLQSLAGKRGGFDVSLAHNGANRLYIRVTRPRGEQQLSKLPDLPKGVGASSGDYSRFADAYGTFPEGEQHIENPVDVPKKVDVIENIDGKDTKVVKNVTRGVRSIMEAAATKEEMLSDYEKMVAEGEFTYDVKRDKQSLDNAVAYIEENGFKNSLDTWDSKVKTGSEIGKEDMAAAQVMYAAAVQAGDYETAQKLAVDIATEATKAGQVVQSMRMLKKLTPEGRLYFIERTMDKLQQEATEKYGENAPDLSLPNEMKQEYAQTSDPVIQQQLLEGMYEYVAKQLPFSWSNFITAWRYLSMLGNVRTQSRNFLSNVISAAAQEYTNIVQAAMEDIGIAKLAVKDGTRTTTLRKPTQAQTSRAKDDYDIIKDSLQGKGKYSAENLTALEKLNNPFRVAGTWGTKDNDYMLLKGIRRGAEAASKGLSAWNNATNWAMDKGDLIFSQHAYVKAFARYLRANNIDPDKMTNSQKFKARAWATKQALESVYREQNAWAELIVKRENKRKREGNKLAAAVIGGTFPFRSTPLNITKRSFEYTPVGIAAELYKQKVKGKNVDGVELLNKAAKSLSGTSLILLGMALSKAGLITGGMGDDKEDKLKKQMGRQEYSFNIGDYSYTMDWGGAGLMPLFIGAQIRQNRAEDDNLLNNVATAIGNANSPITESSMMSGLMDIVQAVMFGNDQDAVLNSIASSLSSYVGQFVPTAAGQIARAVDDTSRSAYSNKTGLAKTIDKTIKKAKNKIPGMSQDNAPYMDVWGNDEKNRGNGFLGRLAYNMLSPGYAKKKSNDKVEKEIQSIFEATGDKGVLPSNYTTHNTTGGVNRRFTQDEYVDYTKTYGETAYTSIEDLLADGNYKNRTKEERAKYIKKAYDMARETAKYDVLDIEPDNSTSKKMKAREMGIPMFMIYAESVFDSSMNTQEAIDFINEYGSDLTETQKAYLFGIYLPTSKSNPWK